MDTMLPELFNDSRDGGQGEELERLQPLVVQVPEPPDSGGTDLVLGSSCPVALW